MFDKDLLVPETGWQPLPVFPWRHVTRSYVLDDTADRVAARLFWEPTTQMLHAKVHFGPMAEGPPGCAHGGSIAAVLDEVMGCCAWANQHSVVAANLNINYRGMVPLGLIHQLHASVTEVDGRKIFVTGQLCHAQTGDVLAEATGLFIELEHGQFKQHRPDAF